MLIQIPDHYRDTMATAMLARTYQVIDETDMMPAFLWQYEDMWTRGINYGTPQTFWQALAAYNPGKGTLTEFLTKRKMLD